MTSFTKSTPASSTLALYAAAPSRRRASCRAARARAAICALFIVVAVAPTLRDDFLFSDDYYWYDIQHSRPSAAAWEATMMTVMNGRPLHGVLLIASLPLLAQRTGWLVLRACGVVLLWCLAWALARALRRFWSEALADWAATALAVLPGFALFSYWLVAMPCLVAAALGALAFELALHSGRRARALGCILLALALSAYQPFALVYFALLGLYAALGGPGHAGRRAFGSGVAAVGGYYLLARACITSFGFDIAKRGELVFAPVLKAHWLLGSALPFAGKLWWIGMPVGVAGVGLCALFVWGLYAARRARHGAQVCVSRGLGMAACAAMTVLPHLSVRETVSRFRTLLPLSVLIALLLMAALIEWARPHLRSLAPRGPSTLIGPGALACFMLFRANELWHLAVVPERALLIQAASELTRARAVRSHGPLVEETRLVHIEDFSLDVVRAGPDDIACVPRLSDDEFTAPSSQHDFAVRGIVRLASELTPGSASVESLTDRKPLPPSAANYVRIDLRRVAAAACARAHVLTPAWGAAAERTAARVE
jgi:hypothetical protein